MATIWLFARQVPLALLPFVVYSVFHVATYTRTNLIPTLYPQTPAAAGPQSPTSASGTPSRAKPSGPVADAIGKFIKEYYDSSMSLVALLEIFLFLRLILSAVMLARGSWILLVAYTVFFRARYAQSPFVQGALAKIGARGDAALANQAANPAIRNAWEQFKAIMHRIVEATDISKYAKGGAPVGAKKAQ
jgi:hypothetical protein